MDPESEKIRQQMEQTRASLAEKLETLEHQVMGTVQQTTSAVNETVENVKEAVQETVGTVKDSVSDTVETVKETFSLARRVERHPWTMFGGSVALGFAAGYLLEHSGSNTERRREISRVPVSLSHLAVGAHPNGGRVDGAGQPARRSEHSWMKAIREQFAPELNKLKELAIGTLIGVLRDAITHSMHEEIGSHLRDVIDSLTSKVGGQPIHGTVLGEAKESPAERNGPTEGSPSRGERPWESTPW
jgi:ElaB/YqjD/DUF883 family membrane-anchored ribosome-binding protein